MVKNQRCSKEWIQKTNAWLQEHYDYDLWCDLCISSWNESGRCLCCHRRKIDIGDTVKYMPDGRIYATHRKPVSIPRHKVVDIVKRAGKIWFRLEGRKHYILSTNCELFRKGAISHE